MKKKSAGILMYRFKEDKIEFLLVHPGGPFWAKKDAGAWSIPKGEFDDDEDPLTAAKREFAEETGFNAAGKFIELVPVKMSSGKLIYTWALQGDIDISNFSSNSFEMEWPPRSGLIKSFPEVDKAAWFNAADARIKINKGQLPLIEQTENLVG